MFFALLELAMDYQMLLLCFRKKKEEQLLKLIVEPIAKTEIETDFEFDIIHLVSNSKPRTNKFRKEN